MAKKTDAGTELSRALTLWRKGFHPRWADVIDRLDEAARRGLGPIRANSAPALTAALVAAIQSNDAVEVGRALATVWPKTWQAQQPIVAALRDQQPDPRIARRLAQLVDEAPGTFHSRGARSLWWQVFKALEHHRDVRQRPLLEAQSQRSKSRYYREYAEEWEAAALKALRGVRPALSKADEKQLVAAEADFAGAVSRETKRASSGAQMLEQVWAHPDDVSARSVYGDWLVEQGDPRGELIALQLGAPSEQATRKAEALIEKHWKKWLGPLCDWFARPPRFEAGFPVASAVSVPSVSAAQLEKLLSRPEWSTFRELSMDWDDVRPAQLLALPRFKALEHLGNVACADVLELAKSRAPLVSLELDSNDDDALARGTWDAFPRLERVSSSFDAAPTIVAGLGKRGLAEVRLKLWSGIDAKQADSGWKALDGSDIGRVVLDFYDGTAVVTRTAPNMPFTKVEVRTASHLDTLAQALPPKTTHLVHSVTPIEIEADDMERLEALLERYESLEVRQLPVMTQAPHARVTLEGFQVFSEARVLEAWAAVQQQFGIAPDQFKIGYSGQARTFVADDLVKAARNSRVSWLYLTSTTSAASVDFARNSMAVCAPVRDVAHFIDSIVAMLELANADSLYFKGGDGTLSLSAHQLARKRAEVVKYLRTVRA